MPLQSPNLDDRDFEQLVEEAKRRIARSCPQWTDLSPSDPGMVLLELFAHLTETMIYRLNRLPEKAFVEFLRLIGVRIQPPAAASVTLRFSRAGESDEQVEIPRGTQVTLSRADGGGEPPVFTTARTVTSAAAPCAAIIAAKRSQTVTPAPARASPRRRAGSSRGWRGRRAARAGRG